MYSWRKIMTKSLHFLLLYQWLNNVIVYPNSPNYFEYFLTTSFLRFVDVASNIIYIPMYSGQPVIVLKSWHSFCCRHCCLWQLFIHWGLLEKIGVRTVSSVLDLPHILIPYQFTHGRDYLWIWNIFLWCERKWLTERAIGNTSKALTPLKGELPVTSFECPAKISQEQNQSFKQPISNFCVQRLVCRTPTHFKVQRAKVYFPPKASKWSEILIFMSALSRFQLSCQPKFNPFPNCWAYTALHIWESFSKLYLQVNDWMSYLKNDTTDLLGK